MKTIPFDTTFAREMIKMADILKVIAHPVRLEILKLLEDSTLTVSDIQEKLDCGCEQSMLSHHLNKMKDKGLLESDKQGKFIYYRLKDQKVLKIFECMSNCSFL